jgi:predicted heme/steroid binding protein
METALILQKGIGTMKLSSFLLALLLAKGLATAAVAAEAESSVVATDIQKEKKTDRDSTTKLLSLTVEQLAHYNGADGNPSYVAIDGIIYDVSPIKAWRKGKHKGRHVAGNELSDELKKNSPHGPKVLKKLKVVGKLVPSAE